MRTFNYSKITEQKWDSELLGLIAAIYKEAGKQLEAREAAEREERYRRMERDRLAAENANKRRIELLRQLEDVQYQLRLLQKLDDFRPANLSTETDIKKALALEEKYNRLYTKERKLKKEIAELEAMG